MLWLLTTSSSPFLFFCPLCISHSAHWIIFNPHHLKPRCMPRQPYGHKPPPSSTHTQNYTLTRVTGVKQCCKPQQVVWVDPACRATCTRRPAHFLQQLSGNPIRLIDKTSRLCNWQALSKWWCQNRLLPPALLFSLRLSSPWHPLLLCIHTRAYTSPSSSAPPPCRGY